LFRVGVSTWRLFPIRASYRKPPIGFNVNRSRTLNYRINASGYVDL